MRALVSAVLLGLLCWVGCSDQAPTEPAPANPGLSAVIVDSANDSLGSIMRTMIDSLIKEIDTTFRPSDVDFRGVNEMYERAVAADPTNLDAVFGAGFTELFTFFSDPDINAFYERAKRFADTTIFSSGWVLPVRAIIVPGGILGPDFLPTGYPLSPRGVPGLIPDLPRLDHALQVTAAADPQPSEFQTLLETRVLPRVVQARAWLLQVAQRRDFVFWITPEMQGNPGADSIELDMTEVRLALAALYAVESAIHVATARHLDLTAYSQAAVEQALNVGSTFLTLKPNGAAKMGSAKTALLATLAQADSALEFLMHESDPDQSDDLIPLGTDAGEILDSLRSARLFLTQVRTTTLKNGGYEIVTDVDAAKFFDDPMIDPKNYLPAYSVDLFRGDTSYKGLEVSYFNAQAYWDSLFSKFGVTYPNDTVVPFYQHLPDQKTVEYYALLAQCQCVWGWSDIQYWGGPQDDCLSYYSNWQQQFMYSYWDQDLHACLHWTATSFATWNFPDPTMNGVFPILTNNELRTFIFPGGSSDWEQEVCVSPPW